MDDLQIINDYDSILDFIFNVTKCMKKLEILLTEFDAE